jgi:CheY-like chemotaxis protein
MRTILVVDDDPGFLNETQGVVGGAGYRVRQAPDGLCAPRLLEEMRANIDLAIVDLACPASVGSN